MVAVLTPKTPAYVLHSLDNDIFCSSERIHYVTVFCEWHLHMWHCRYEIETGAFSDKRLPKYLKAAVERKLLSVLKSGNFKVHEHHDDNAWCYDNLRYHDDEWVTRTIARLEREVGE